MSVFFFFNDTATTEIYTLSLHDALPISLGFRPVKIHRVAKRISIAEPPPIESRWKSRSEEHTSELQSRRDLVCRLLLEKKKTTRNSSGQTGNQLTADEEHEASPALT